MGTSEISTIVQQHTTARLEYSRVLPGRKLLLAEQVFSHLNSATYCLHGL